MGDDLVNVVFVVGLTVVSNAELSVGGIGSAVTVGQVVDDNGHDLVGASGLKVVSKRRDLGDLVEPDKGGDLSNAGSQRLQAGVRDLRKGSRDLRGVDRADEVLQGGEDD